MKAIILSTFLGFASFAQAELTIPVAKNLIEKRQSAMGRPTKAKVLTIDSMADYKGSKLYRVNAAVLGGEQTYQIRYPLKSADAVTDVLLTTSIYSQYETAKDLKVSESELAIMVQAASDAAAKSIAKEFPEIKRTGIYTFANGERFRAPAALILIVQESYEGMSVPLLRKTYVDRKTKAVQVGYGD